jgi:hypothetical protein
VKSNQGPERSCDGKVRHPNRRAAMGAMWAAIRDHDLNRSELTVYRCAFCESWHVGHRKNVRRRDR